LSGSGITSTLGFDTGAILVLLMAGS